MTSFRVNKGSVAGSISIPGSKSHTLRAILFASLAEGKSRIYEYLPSSDSEAMIQACKLLGASIKNNGNHLEIEGINGNVIATEDVIQADNSGIILRFISTIAALSSHYTIITGDHSIRHRRPIQPLLKALRQLGVFAQSTRGDGFAPVIIKGPLKSGTVTIDGQDSQPVSALLIAAAFVEGITSIHVVNPGEIPWVKLTLNWLDRLGIRYENHNFTHYRVFGKTQYKGFDYTVPGDLSTAAFPIAAALVTNSELTIKNIDMTDSQGDKELIYVLQKMGALIDIENQTKQLIVKRNGRLKGIEVDINPFVDGVPILTVLACFAEGKTHIKNAAVARHKECDRLNAIATELKKMGAQITELPEGLMISRSSLTGSDVFSHNDHRMAMSLMVAGMGAEGETRVNAVECVSKTYPHIGQDFKELGANIEIEP